MKGDSLEGYAHTPMYNTNILPLNIPNFLCWVYNLKRVARSVPYFYVQGQSLKKAGDLEVDLGTSDGRLKIIKIPSIKTNLWKVIVMIIGFYWIL